MQNTITTLITAFGSLFTFIIGALGDIADFFTSNALGVLILSVGIFSIVWGIFSNFLNKIK